jgi:hypothetical protein
MMADKKALNVGSESSTESVVKLLTSILSEVQKQVQRDTPKPLEGVALQAVEQFKEISDALALQPAPTITLTANPNSVGVGGGTTRLAWSSTNARRVSIVGLEVGTGAQRDIGEVKPAAGGSIEVFVGVSTTFRATATGACSSPTAEATIKVEGIL